MTNPDTKGNPGEQQQIIDGLEGNHDELAASDMTDDKVAAATKATVEALETLLLLDPPLDDTSKIDGVIRKFLMHFGYIPHIEKDDGEKEAHAKRTREDDIHTKISNFAALRQLSDADMVRYFIRLQAAIDLDGDTVRRTNLMRGLNLLLGQKTDDTSWDKATRVATVIMTSMVYADYAKRAELPTPLELLPTKTEYDDYVNQAINVFTPGELNELLLIIRPLCSNEAVVNNAFALACDMHSANKESVEIIHAMLKLVYHIQAVGGEQSGSLQVVN